MKEDAKRNDDLWISGVLVGSAAAIILALAKSEH